MEWMKAPIVGLVSISLLVSLVECAAGDDERIGGLRMICGAAVSASVINMLIRLLGQAFG